MLFNVHNELMGETNVSFYLNTDRKWHCTLNAGLSLRLLISSTYFIKMP